MKKFLALCAVAALALPTAAEARDDRLTVHEIYNFVNATNMALANASITVGKSYLQRNLAENAQFETNFKGLVHTSHYVPVWYGDAYNPYAYRYPYPHYTKLATTGVQRLGKWDKITNFENKKRLVAGYKPVMKITEIHMPAEANSAVVDVDLVEYGTSYAPHNPYLRVNAVQAESKCKLYLSERNEKLFVTRMDCNSLSNLPL